MHRIVVLALQGANIFELGIPERVFASAVDRDGKQLYSVQLCSLGGRSVRSTNGLSIQTGKDESALASANTVVIPALHDPEAEYFRGGLGDELAAAMELIPVNARVVSICTGAFVLAGTGRLDGRRATTHWNYAELFKQIFPQVELDPDVLFVDDGELLTSAGAASGLDVCLHLVRRDYGSEVANDVARHCVVPAWREGGQAQYIQRPMPEQGEGGARATREWAAKNLSQDLSLSRLARHAGMSTRTFTRRFRQETGVSPAAWVLNSRLDLARALLERAELSDLSIEEVARRSGIGTSAALRQNFKAVLGISPAGYRKTFSAGN